LLYWGQFKFPRARYKKDLRLIIVWLVPMVAISTIWPAYAAISGDFGEWADGVFWQGTQRQSQGKSLLDTLGGFWSLDPIMFILGFAGVALCTVRRDLLPLLWIGPYFILLYLVGWVTHFHLILVIPALCIAMASLIDYLSHLARPKRAVLVSSVAISAVAIFGLVITIMIITTDVSSAQLEAIAFVAHDITNKTDLLQHVNREVTIAAGPAYSWVFKYVFDNPDTFSHLRDTGPIMTNHVILAVDSTYKHVVSKTEKENITQVLRLGKLYDNTDIIAIFKNKWPEPDLRFYPYTEIEAATIGSRTEEIRANY
jgi:hypothetical protein